MKQILLMIAVGALQSQAELERQQKKEKGEAPRKGKYANWN
jgi:hypothetical protein